MKFVSAGDFEVCLDPMREVLGRLSASTSPWHQTLTHGKLVVESICEQNPTQQDTVTEGVCTNLDQGLYKSSMKNTRVSLTGAYVENEEHRWCELHLAPQSKS